MSNFPSNLRESTAENNVDVMDKFTTKEFLLNIYPYLTGMGNQIITAGLFGWGLANDGRIGNGQNTGTYSTPTQTISYGVNWKQSSCGKWSGMAIKTDGTLWGWGYNAWGMIGTGNTTSYSSPIQTSAYGTNWKQIACGGKHSAAIKTDGTLWSCGYNGSGALGISDGVSRSSMTQTTAAGTTWKQVACGYTHTAAIKTDGTLWNWGYNTLGQIGVNDVTHRYSPVQTITYGTNWKQVSCGQHHTAAIKTDGTLWVCGYNNYGQLGTNDITKRSSPIQTVAYGTNWKQVACGFQHTAAIKTDGTLWNWGYNSTYAQLGTNNLTNYSSPIQTVAYGTNWKQVSCGYYHTTAIKTDGTLWLWGFGAGINTYTNNTSSPIQNSLFGNTWKSVADKQSEYHSSAIRELGDDF